MFYHNNFEQLENLLKAHINHHNYYITIYKNLLIIQKFNYFKLRLPMQLNNFHHLETIFSNMLMHFHNFVMLFNNHLHKHMFFQFNDKS